MGKRRLRTLKRILRLLIYIIIILLLILFILMLRKGKDNFSTMYLASFKPQVSIYNDVIEEVLKLDRGVEVKVYDEDIVNDSITYKKISYEDKIYYVNNDDLVVNASDVVKEKNLFVRTPVTVYQNNLDSSILGHLSKGSEVTITGFDHLDSGIVNMYKIKYEDSEGYVYGKYLVETSELAMQNYNENGIYDIHKDRKYGSELYGGQTKNLDYYPYQKVRFDDNKLLEDAHTLYLNASPNVLNNVDEYIDLAKKSNINAFVVDIKDGFLAYQSQIAKRYSNTAYKSAQMSMEEYKNVITKLKDNGFYVIGRIVAFNDSHFSKDNPDEAISRNGQPTSWTSAYSRMAWQYNVELAKEAILFFNFNEIQFDYVRFPETSYTMSTDSSYNFKNKYNEEKGQAIQNFLFYATDEIHKLKAYISVDVFGECSNEYVTAYGQYWPAISNIVDVISSMPYPDHFNKYAYGLKEPVWTTPYELLLRWGKDAKKRQEEIPTPALARTWIQAYDAIHTPKVTYDDSMVSQEIKALYEVGLTNGYITWNANSSLTKYKEISKAFTKDYR